MTTTSATFTQQLLKKNLKRIAAHWGLISVMLGVIGTLFGIGVLYSYFQAIGLPELLPRALDTRTSLIPWLILVGFLFALCLVAMLSTSTLYACAVATFNRQPSYQPAVALLLALPASTGITVLVVTIFQYPEYGTNWKLLASGLTVMLTTLSLMAVPKFKTAIDVTAFMTHPERGLGKIPRIGLLFTVIGILCGTVFSAVAPVLLLLQTYQGPEDPLAVTKLTWMSVLAAVLTLLPPIAFFFSSEGLWVKLRNVLIGVVAMTVAMLSMAPATLPVIVYRAAQMMGLRDTQLSFYLLTDTYARTDFDQRWGAVTTLRKHPVVEAFPLFALGDLLLLCPASLVDTKLKNWPEVSWTCLITDTKTAKRMPQRAGAKPDTATNIARPNP